MQPDQQAQSANNNQPPQAVDTDPSIPASWPGAFGLYKFSRAAVRNNLGALVVLWVASFAIPLILQVTLHEDGRLVGQLVSLILSVTTTITLFAGVRGQHLSLGQAFKNTKPLLVIKYFVNTIFMAFALAFSLLLLIVPFFIIFPRVVLSPYLLIDRNLGPLEAINTSWELTKGHAMKMWSIVGASIAMALLAVTIIGIPFAVYFLFMYSAAFAIACLFIAGEQPLATAPVAEQPSDTSAAAPVVTPMPSTPTTENPPITPPDPAAPTAPPNEQPPAPQV